MKEPLFFIFGVVSLLLVLIVFLYERLVHRKRKIAHRIFSRVQLYTLWVFFGVVALFIPIYYTAEGAGYVRPFLLAIHNALRVFILDGEFDVVARALPDADAILGKGFALYAACLYVVAPILTFGNVLSLFKNLQDEARFGFHRKRAHYIMSELNPRSVALAKSIWEKAKAEKKKIVIVFTDVFERNEEDGYELLSEARDMNAICLKKDIRLLNLQGKKGDVELFLLGEDASENVSQAVKIVNTLNEENKKQNVKVFLFDRNQSSSYIMDSIRYDNLLEYAHKHEYGPKTFKLRRVDEIQQLVWDTVPTMDVFEKAKETKVISILLVGMGRYGREFFKTLVWFCQCEGYRLEFNVIDKHTDGEDGHRSIESLLRRQCPELLEKNRCLEEGESSYDIEFFTGIEMRSSDFSDVLLYEGEDAEKRRIAERLRRTTIAVVALGEDDMNIEVAVYLRTLFDRANGIQVQKDIACDSERPAIYSIVYDGQKAGVLQSDGHGKAAGSEFLVNYREIPYHVRFIGSFSSQFDYSRVYSPEMEEQAGGQHQRWNELSTHEDENRKRYQRFEYYRLSSIARDLHKKEMEKSFPELYQCENAADESCECELCAKRKRIEHMRWNAYMRSLGYVMNETRADRAKTHNDLRAWHELPSDERQKD